MSVKQKNYVLKKTQITSNEYTATNKLYIYTILVILGVSLLGITGLTDDYILSLTISQLCMVIPAVVYLYLMKTNPLKRMGFGKVKAIPLMASVVMGFSIIPFISMINSISMLFVKNVTDSKVSTAAEEYPLSAMLIMVALLPALVEEVLYRGIYFGVYRKAGVIKGALLVALIFAFMHGNLNQFAYAIVAGFLFAMIDYAGGSVIYSIVMHFIINGTTVLTLYAKKLNVGLINKLAEETEYFSVGQVVSDMWLSVLVGLVITAVGYMIIRRLGCCEEDSDRNIKTEQMINNEGKKCYAGEQTDENVLDVYLGTGLVIMLINIIANEVM